MRSLPIKNDSLLKELKRKGEITERIQKLGKESEKIEKEYNKLLAKLSRIDEKVKPEIKKIGDGIEKGEFEQLSRVYLEDDKVMFEIADRLEEFKLGFRDAIKRASDPKPKGSEKGTK